MENNDKNNTLDKSGLIKVNYINLKNAVKSKYIINKIFSLLTENDFLTVIKYNKSLQEFLGITLEKYKEISGKIKIGGKNGYNRIYELYKMNLIYEGEYLNGKRNGQGIEYVEGKLKFEGEYLNGFRVGKGKEYKLD